MATQSDEVVSRGWPGWRRWERDESGVAAVEYALIVALIVAAAVVALEGLSTSMKTAMRPLHDGPAVTEVAGDIAEAAAFTADASLPAATVEPGFWSTASGWRMYLALAALVGLGIAVLFRQRGSAADEAEELEELEPVVPGRMQAIAERRRQILQVLSSRTQDIFAAQLKVRHLMSRPAISVEASASAEEALAVMDEAHLRTVMVTDGADCLVGLISREDLERRPGATAREKMTPDPLSVSCHAPLDEALNRMAQRQLSCIPTTDHGKLVGVLTTTDIILALQCTVQTLQRMNPAQMNPDFLADAADVEVECTLQMLQQIVAQETAGAGSGRSLREGQADLRQVFAPRR